jgi:5,10-methenyltetrahydromethanopterin hydrogenase
MAISTNLERLNYDSEDGCIAPGQHAEVIAAGSTKTLLASDSGSTVLMDQAAGSVITLPAPAVGMVFDIAVSISVTSNSHIITVADTATEFLGGGLQMMIDTTAVSEGQFLNGTSHITLTHNGSTTGGLIGTQYRFVAISSTVWMVTGLCAGSGTLATPATT